MVIEGNYNKNKRRKDMALECVKQEVVSGLPEINHEWKDANDTITVWLDCGTDQCRNRIKCFASEQSITLHLEDGRKWSCELYDEIDEASFCFKTEDSIVEMSAKKVEGSLWPHAFKSACRQSEYRISQMNTSLYEKGSDYVTICFYVKNTKREAVSVDFKEKEMTISFKTSHTKFLKQFENCDEDTLFIYHTALRDFIDPKLSQFSVTGSAINVTIRKKTSTKWETFAEPPPEESKRTAVAANTFIPIVNSATTTKTGTTTTIGSVQSTSSSQLSLPPVGNLISESKKKPTCMVPPLNVAESGVSVGLTGLDNLGNSCFMNSVIQTLVNTRELRDYFLDLHFRYDINVDNPLGFKGHLAVTYANLCKTLWSGRHHSCEPSKLKALVSTKASQFTGFAQHDAQEFMAFLLDGLHEDLNRITNRPYVETKDWEGEPDEVFAEECWNRFKMRDDSAIVDLFQGQYKSKLVCPVCHHVSIKFDPFFYLSVPLPKKFRYLPIYFFSKDPSKKPVKYILKILPETTIDNLKEQISLKTKVHVSNLRIFEVYKSKILRVFGKLVNLSVISPKDLIFAVEVLSAQLAGEPVVEILVVQRILMPNRALKCSFCDRYCPAGVEPQLKRCTKCYRVSYCDQSCQKNHWSAHKVNCKPCPELVGMPFIISLPQSQATYSKLYQMMELYARYSVDLFHPPIQNAEPYLSSSGSTSSISSSGSDSGENFPLLDMSNSDLLSNENESKKVMPDNESDYGSMIQSGVSNDFVNSSSSSLSGNEARVTEDSACEDNSHPPVRIVFGQSRSESTTERTDPMFFIQPVNQHGISLLGVNGKRLEDLRDTPLDLSSSSYYAMDWRNNWRMKNYVLVQSKNLEIDESQSDMNGYDDQGHFTLDQCLQLFTEPETLAPEEAWYCPKCKHHREATKQMSIWRLPTVLIVQLKRFSFKGYLYKDKIDKMVTYPVRGLDLTPYYSGSQLKQRDEPPPIYDLYAVINHYGNILGGHYTAFARLMDKGVSSKTEIDWRLFDDSHVSWESESKAVSRSAYVLFYRRRGVECDLSKYERCTNSVVGNSVNVVKVEPSECFD